MEIYTTESGTQYVWISDNGNYESKYYTEIDNSKNNPYAMERRCNNIANAFNALIGLLFK